MNNRGQMGVGLFIAVAVVVIVGTVLFLQIAQDVGTITSTRVLANESITLGALNSINSIPGQAIVGSLIMTNQSGNTTIDSGNYTTADNQVVNGQLTATITVDDANIASETVYLWYTAEPDGYLPSNARAVAVLIILLTAFAIGAVALIPAFRSKFMELLGR